jgi:hypothetical protein
MRTLFRILTALTAGGLLAAGVGVAHADDISNNIDVSIDAVAEVMPLNVGGPSGTTTLYLTPRNGDGKNGCNLTAGTTLGLSLSSSNTGVASVSPSSVTFTSCGETKTLTISPVAAGPATITASQTSNDTGATFNLAPVTFTVNVTAPAPSNTAPSVSVGGVTGGASYDKGSVPSATCNVTDAEDGNSSFPATLSAITGPHATDGIGSQTASCSYSDNGGLTASSSVTYNIIDPTAPVISYTLAPAAPDGSNGWYTSDVTLTWTVTESESPNSLSKAGCVDQNITTDQVATTYSCSATSAGGSAGPVDVTIKRDATAPSVSYTSASGTEGTNGWYTSAVTATFTGTDATSGPATADQTATSSGEGAAVTIDSPAFTDNAGNITATGAASQSFKIDLTDPINVAFLGGPAADASSYFGSVPAAPTCTADDAVSGLASCQVSGYSTSVGSHTLTATATDNAGRTATATRSYTVLAWTLNGFYQPVDMNGVWNTVKGGSTVPLKFEVFAGSTELTSTSVVQSFNTQKINCTSGASTEDAIEVLSAGGTSLRYDSAGGQFIQNWKTPTGAGSCYSATMTTLDGSRITAQFKIK